MKNPCTWRLIILAQLFFIIHGGSLSNYTRGILRNETEALAVSPVKLLVYPNEVIMSNGIVSVTFSNPQGDVTAIRYGRIENILDTLNKEDNRGYWDVVWNGDGDEKSMFYDTEESNIDIEATHSVPIDRADGTHFKVIVQNENQVEISFSRTWKWSGAPLNIDKRFIMHRGSSGFYAYGIFERKSYFPASRIDQIRIVFKLREDLFDYMAISDEIQKVMPSNKDRANGETLDYPEAVRLENGEVDDKYQYASDNKDNKVHGWISRKENIGFWIITPSDEFRTGGPLKRDLTSHCGPTSLSMFVSTHYAGLPLAMYFENKEPWKKVFGPVFIYLNSNKKTWPMWEDAKLQLYKETLSWPYNFPLSSDFPRSNQRGVLIGKLNVQDGYISLKFLQGAYAYVGLAAPGKAGSWQYESKWYQFWTKADNKGNFVIKGVRPGNYNLFAWVPGLIGDYKYDYIVTISPGFTTRLNHLLFKPPRVGVTLWEIGYPDRSSQEFYIPNSDPYYSNYIFKSFEKFRQYGLWYRYSQMYPRRDLVYIIGLSNHTKHWLFAQVTRNSQKNVFEGTTWQIVFRLEHIEKNGMYTLQLAIAGASGAELQVRVNRYEKLPLFTTGLIGTENMIARHSNHGLYRLYSVSFRGSQLYMGKNVIYLTQTRGRTPFNGLMYDYIRLEAPSRR
ncbi:probable rhamnogalacturonate lyase B [Impatiens glandulifera]|uniref:probable rhamnogalacturonate lyase B n=1 Tax=Impatiens glandulifera TaxID=253017 RepID=UPI001FB0E7FD|nr:probable rhamnogalacturonate lyase B [Impatiens glandulifera]